MNASIFNTQIKYVQLMHSEGNKCGKNKKFLLLTSEIFLQWGNWKSGLFKHKVLLKLFINSVIFFNYTYVFPLIRKYQFSFINQFLQRSLEIST